jgi:hypothetical protein
MSGWGSALDASTSTAKRARNDDLIAEDLPITITGCADGFVPMP